MANFNIPESVEVVRNIAQNYIKTFIGQLSDLDSDEIIRRLSDIQADLEDVYKAQSPLIAPKRIGVPMYGGKTCVVR